MKLPKITVVTPSFNQGDYIERTIESVLSQGYAELEYIVVDGGSRDQSVQVIRSFERHLSYWVSEPDRGQSDALNKGLRRATGDVLTWLNSDDWFEAGALHRLIDALLGDPRADLAVGRGRVVDFAGRLVFDSPPPPRIDFERVCRWLTDGNFLQPAAVFTRRAWERYGPLREDLHLAMDLDFWLRATSGGMHGVTVDAHVATALSHPQAKTTTFVNEMLVECARVIASHGSQQGYEDLVSKLLAKDEFSRLQLQWFRRNYGIVVSHPLLRLLQPIIKRVSSEGRYWQASIPPWTS